MRYHPWIYIIALTLTAVLNAFIPSKFSSNTFCNSFNVFDFNKYDFLNTEFRRRLIVDFRLLKSLVL